MAYAKRVRAGLTSDEVSRARAECAFSMEFPCLAAFLLDGKWEDGTPRECGTLLLCEGDGLVKAWLNDRAEGQTAWLSARTLGELLVVVEEGLSSDQVEWRVAQQAPRGKAKK